MAETADPTLATLEQTITRNPPRVSVSNGINMLSEALGARALACSDDFFAEMGNMLKPQDAVFIAHKYTERGKWMDGWESRRKRVAGYDWCVLRLGVAGVINALDIDTAHFLGNHAPIASVDACCAPNCDDSPEALAALPWSPLLGQVPLNRGAQNIFTTGSTEVVTHLRLNIFPDGGVARLRAYGEPAPSWTPSVDDERFELREGEVDLAALRNGGEALLCSDMFFGVMSNLIAPGRARVMGEGWETRRSRRVGFDWIVVKLGERGRVSAVGVDTNHFKGNFPESVALLGVDAPHAELTDLADDSLEWRTLLPRDTSAADEERLYRDQLADIGPITHVKLLVYPDGGVSRLRVYGAREPLEGGEGD